MIVHCEVTSRLGTVQAAFKFETVVDTEAEAEEFGADVWRIYRSIAAGLTEQAERES